MAFTAHTHTTCYRLAAAAGKHLDRKELPSGFPLMLIAVPACLVLPGTTWCSAGKDLDRKELTEGFASCMADAPGGEDDDAQAAA